MFYNDYRYTIRDLQDRRRITEDNSADIISRPSSFGVCENDLKETEKALRETEKNFQAILNATTDMAFLMDTEGVILAANENTARVYGTTMDALIGARIYDFLPHKAAHKSMENADRAARSGLHVRFQGTLRGKIFDNSIYPVFDEKGNVKRLAVYSRDITEAKQFQDALRKTEEKYRNIFENATEGIFQISPDGRLISANPSLARIHGYSTAEELTKSVDDVTRLFVDSEKRIDFTRSVQQNDRVYHYETEMFRRDGAIRWISINARTVRDKDGKTLYHEGTMQDITERKKAEDALAESEERYRTAIEHSNDGVSIIQGDMHLFVNKRLVEMFGYESADEIVGQPITITVHPDDTTKVVEINKRRQMGIPVLPRYEFKGITKQGRVIFIDVSATSIMYRGVPVSLVYLRDITERKRSEEALRQSHLELERLNRAKTKAVNHISHELKTPLAVVQGNIRILKRKLEATPLGEAVRSNLEVLERNLDRLFDISKQTDQIFRVSQELEAGVLLGDLEELWQRMEDFSEIPPDIRGHWSLVKRWMSQYMSGSHLSFQSIDLYPFLQSLVEKVKLRVSHRAIDFLVQGENDLYVFMDPGVLGDVLESLLKNAVENTPEGGVIRVSADQRDGATAIHVTDYGVGIIEENLQYLFDGLFDTREVDLYTSKKPYDFGAGGKGFDLMRVKMYGKRFGFDVSVQSRRCACIPTDQDICPGNVSQCPGCQTSDDCVRYGGTTFTVSFPRRENQNYSSHVL